MMTKVNIRTITQREIAETICKNLIDIHFDMIDEIDDSLTLMNELLNAALRDKNDFLHQLNIGNGPIMLPTNVIDEIEMSEDDNTIFTVVNDDGDLWTMFQSQDVER
jgi:hypothetical protein